MYEVGSWFVYLMNGAILAFIALIVLIWVLRKRGQHAKEVEGKILADIWLPTGRSITGLARPTPDAWVKLGKLGDYRLATPKKICTCGHDEAQHELSIKGGEKDAKEIVRGKCSVCECTGFVVERTLSPIRRWGKYPSNPFLGLKSLQVDVMTESWWLNNPEPITPLENRTLVTSVDAAFHTRESDAEKASVEINEQEARQRQLNEAIANQPSKIVVYIGLGAVVLLEVIGLIQTFAGG